MIPASPLAARGHKQCRIPHTLTREPRGHWRQDRLLLSRLALLSHSLKTQITPGVHCGSREPRAVEAGSCLRLVFPGQTRPVLLESGHFRGQGDLGEDHGLGAAPTWVGFSPRGKHELEMGPCVWRADCSGQAWRPLQRCRPPSWLPEVPQLAPSRQVCLMETGPSGSRCHGREQVGVECHFWLRAEVELQDITASVMPAAAAPQPLPRRRAPLRLTDGREGREPLPDHAGEAPILSQIGRAHV